jgi:hypothetical protein
LSLGSIARPWFTFDRTVAAFQVCIRVQDGYSAPASLY